MEHIRFSEIQNILNLNNGCVVIYSILSCDQCNRLKAAINENQNKEFGYTFFDCKLLPNEAKTLLAQSRLKGFPTLEIYRNATLVGEATGLPPGNSAEVWHQVKQRIDATLIAP